MRRRLLALGLPLLALSLAPAGPARSGEPAEARLRDIEHSLYERVNSHRVARGLPALRRDPALDDLARAHSRAMASGASPFGHDGFQERRRAIKAALPLQRASENVSIHPQSERASIPEEALEVWLGSGPHRRNLEADDVLTGVGVAVAPDGTAYVTQIYVKTRPEA